MVRPRNPYELAREKYPWAYQDDPGPSRVRQLAGDLANLAVTVVLLVGLPIVMLKLAPWPPLPIPHHFDLTRDGIQGWYNGAPWEDPRLVIGTCVTVGWICWAILLLDTAYTLLLTGVDAVRYRRLRPRIPGRSPTRVAARMVVAGLIATTVAITSRLTAAHAAPPAPPAAVAAQHQPHSIDFDQPLTLTTVGHTTAHTDRVHTVVAGDTLWDLASRYLDDGRKWPALYSANRGRAQPDGQRLTDPGVLMPGWRLRIPTPGAGAVPPRPPHHPGARAAQPPVDPTPRSPRPRSSAPGTPRPATPTPGHTVARPDRRATASHGARQSAWPGIVLRTGGYLTGGLVVAIAAAAALRAARNRTTTPASRPAEDLDDPGPETDTTTLSRHAAAAAASWGLPDTDQLRLATPTASNADGGPVAVPVADDPNDPAWAAVPLTDLGSPGVGLVGPGADRATRAIVATALTSGALLRPGDQAQVVTTTDTIRRLLDRRLPAGRLERLTILDTDQQLLDYLDTELVRRCPDDTAPEQAAPCPPLFVVASPMPIGLRIRLQACAAAGRAVGLHVVTLDTSLPGHRRIHLDRDGHTTTSEGRPVRLSMLSSGELSEILATVGDIDGYDPLRRPAAPADPPARPVQDRDVVDPTVTEPVGHGARTESVGTGDHFVGVATPQVSVLGAITINTDHGTLWSGGDTALAELVAALAAHRDGIDREHLLDLIWDDQLPDAADTRLAAALERLDQLLCHARGDHTPAVVSTGSMLRFNPKAVIVDLWALDDAIDATSPDADLDNPDDAVTPAVLAEWIHDIADTFAPFAPSLAAPWAGHQRETIRRRLAAASTRWARQLAEVDHPDTVTVLRVAHTADPYNIEVGVDLLTRLTRAGADTTNAQTAATLAATWRTLLHDAGQWDGETSTLDDTARTVIEQAIHPPDATTRGASCTDGL